MRLGAGAYVPVITFLKTAGQTQVISQCEHVETELCNLMHQRRAMLKGCVDVLQAYCQLAQQVGTPKGQNNVGLQANCPQKKMGEGPQNVTIKGLNGP